jgi:hypothetical protein
MQVDVLRLRDRNPLELLLMVAAADSWRRPTSRMPTMTPTSSKIYPAQTKRERQRILRITRTIVHLNCESYHQ